jgi:hypothetical protein
MPGTLRLRVWLLKRIQQGGAIYRSLCGGAADQTSRRVARWGQVEGRPGAMVGFLLRVV